VREINVSHAGDPVHAGDKALTRETPAKRWINISGNSPFGTDEKCREIRMVKVFK
jgi:hypothetical protein